VDALHVALGFTVFTHGEFFSQGGDSRFLCLHSELEILDVQLQPVDINLITRAVLLH